jgi:alkylhydroperoxidase family enzyme
MPPRVTQVRTAGDYPHELDSDEARQQVDRMFTRFGEMTGKVTGQYAAVTAVPTSFAQIFNVPRFGELMVELTDYVVNELPWAKRLRLRELALLALYERQRCDYAYRVHLRAGAAAGITEEQIADMPLYRTSEAFDDEERDVIEFTHGVLENLVSDELFERLKARYGEQEVVEMTAVVSFWAFWGMMIGTLQPDYEPIH